MPGAEFFGAEEQKEVNEVMQTGILFRYNHDQQRQGIWKAREFEAEVCKFTGAKYAHAVSSGSTAVATAPNMTNLSVVGIIQYETFSSSDVSNK
jgi:8-amino-3,8-dideoxy-alpha-D-manno-octulosonate transaminase